MEQGSVWSLNVVMIGLADFYILESMWGVYKKTKTVLYQLFNYVGRMQWYIFQKFTKGYGSKVEV